MKPSQMTPQPRCAFVGQTQEGDISRCARWASHAPPQEHLSYTDVIEQMAQAVAAVLGRDELNTFAMFDCIQQARVWHTRLVVTT